MEETPVTPEYVSSMEAAYESSMEPLETQSVADRREPRLSSTPESTTDIADAEGSESLAAHEKIPYVSDRSSQATGETHGGDGVQISVARKVWTLEMASLLLATLVFGGIMAILATRDGRELPNWPYLPNISALVSILTAVFKVTLLFPLARIISGMEWDRLSISRPPRGADWWEGGRGMLKAAGKTLSRNRLILLGAVLAFLSLGIDPFYQQALQFSACSTSAEIPRVNRYDEGDANADPPTVSEAMTAALDEGMWNPAERSALASITPGSVDCPLGHCIFENTGAVNTYSSLFMCSSVNTIPSDNHGMYSSGWTSGWNVSLPSGLALLGQSAMATRQLEQVPPWEVPGSSKSLADHPTWWEEIPMFAFEILMVGLNCDPSDITTIYGSDSIIMDDGSLCFPVMRAFNISLFPCVQKYANITYTSGVLQQQIISTTRLPFIREGNYFSLATKEYPGPASALDSSSNADCSPSASPVGGKYVETKTLYSGRRYRSMANSSVEEIANAGGNISFYDPMCIYELAHGSLVGLEHALGSMVGGATEEAKTLEIPDGVNGRVVGDPWLKYLWNKGRADIHSLRLEMDGLAWSISAAIREGTGDWDRRPFRAVGYDSRICVGVGWAWVSYPGVVLFLAGVFFIFASLRRGGQVMNRTADTSVQVIV